MTRLSKHNNSQGGWNTRIGAIAISCMALLLPACANNNEQAAAPESPSPATQTEAPAAPEPTQNAENVTTQEVSEKTAALIGKPVTVRSEPVQRLNDNAFTISDSEVFGGERILVVNASGDPINLPEPQDAQLQITGTVAKFNANTIKQEYGLDLGNQDLYREYEGRPAIIAQSIALAPTPGEIAEQPQTYYNKVIAVPAEVATIYSPQAFTLENDALFGTDNLLVLVTSPLKNTGLIKEGGRIVATGTLRELAIADIEREFNLGWDQQLRSQIEKEYNNKPVLIVKGVYPSALPENAK
ncbi:hypothetical protein [Fischerella sp. PCC 9605]|uniref:hypothetical protein n=1 Tax=Fischerella sp. PCC 9605 TaxID=1173024 RepID=UPI00047B46D6|nr:hypothetical protein [Fischerella sp. PCC 9605]